MFVHNQTSLPQSSPGILLKPGTHSDIVVKKSFSSLVPSPYSKCENIDLLYFDRYIWNFTTSFSWWLKIFSNKNVFRTFFNVLDSASIAYNHKDCLDLCLQQEIIKKCDCYYLEFFKLNNTKPCLAEHEIECSNIIYEEFSIQDTVKLCPDQCPLEYESLKYEFTISTAGICFN